MRLKDWPRRLSVTLQASIGREFAWGHHDCFTFAGEVALALTGSDPTAAMHGRYCDYVTGLRAARALLGVVGLRGFGDRLYRRTPFASAMRGDWALVRTEEGPALAIVDGPLLRDAAGGMLPLTEAACCWRVE